MDEWDLLQILVWQAPAALSAVLTLGIAAVLAARQSVFPAVLVGLSAVVRSVVIVFSLAWNVMAGPLFRWAGAQNVEPEFIILAYQVVANGGSAVAWALLFAGALAGGPVDGDAQGWSD